MSFGWDKDSRWNFLFSCWYFAFIMVVMNASTAFTMGTYPDLLFWIIVLCTGVLAIIGGIFGFAKKRIGGILVLAGIGLAIVLSIVITLDLSPSDPPMCE